MGDGSGVVMLESLEHAQRRGARILAEVAGYGMSADAYHMTNPAPEGRGAQQAMRAALADARVAPADIGYVNAHGTSTPPGDVAETAAMKKVFGEHAYKLVFGSTKSMTGHLLGAAGGLEFAICTLVLGRGVIPPTINYVTPDPECDLDCAPNHAVERRVDVAMSNSFGFGGHNVSLIVKRFDA
jgi:3-oxoacyl-[acyl-carrier-protein] synthase II